MGKTAKVIFLVCDRASLDIMRILLLGNKEREHSVRWQQFQGLILIYNYSAFSNLSFQHGRWILNACPPPNHAILCKTRFVLFFSILMIPCSLPCSMECTMTDTVVIMFIIRNLVPNNWTLPADNMFKQMWCIQMRKGQGTGSFWCWSFPYVPRSHYLISAQDRKENEGTLDRLLGGALLFALTDP